MSRGAGGRRTHPWIGVLAAFAAVLLIPAGVLAGSAGGGIEPDGQFIPCGPVLFGRHDQNWDSRCVAAGQGWRTVTICILVLGGFLLIVAIASMIRNRRIRRERLRDGAAAEFRDDSVHRERHHDANPQRWWQSEAAGTDEPASPIVEAPTSNSEHR